MDVFTLQSSVILNSNAETQLKKLQTEAQNTDTKFSTMSEKITSFGNGLTSMGEKMLTKFTLPVTGALGAAVKLASDLNESMNKVEVAFKDNATQVKAWGDTTLEKFGIAKGTALDMVSLYGDMATGMGFTTTAASALGEQLVGRAADLSSFKNIGIKEATTALNGVFTGETESLKALGVVMTQANLQQYAYSEGIKKNIKDMTQQEQVQLRFNYVMDATKNASGDFARTADGTANSLRQMTESFKQLGEVWGQRILPIITPIVQKITEISTNLAKVNTTTQDSVLGFGAFVAALAPALIVFGGIVTTIGDVDKGVRGAIGGVSEFGGTAINKFKDAKDAISGFGEKLSPLSGIVGEKLSPVTGIFDTLTSGFSGFLGEITGVLPAGLGTAVSGVTGVVGTLGSTAVSGLTSMVGTAMSLIAPATVIGLLLLGLGVAQQELGTQLTGTIDTIIAKAPKLIDDFVASLLTKIPDLISSGTTLLMKILEGIIATAPSLLTGATEVITSIINGVTTNLPRLLPMVLDVINTILTAIINNLPQILAAGLNLLVTLVQGISNNTDKIVTTITGLITQIITVIAQNLPQIITAGINILVAIITGISQAIPQLISSLPQIFNAILNGLKGMDWAGIGTNIINGIITGVKSMASGLAQSVKNAASGALDMAKSFLGIHSPSRKFRDEIGQYIPAGIAVGIEQNGGVINDQLKQLSDDMAFDSKINTTLATSSNLALSSNTPLKTQSTTTKDIGSTKYDAQTQQQPIVIQNNIKLELDGREITYSVAENQDILDRYNSRTGGAFA